MEQERVSDRRTSRDRRVRRTSTYTGPERRAIGFRRSGYDRRKGWPPICTCCGNICGVNKKWSQGASTVESTVDSMISICPDCSKKHFPQFYSGN